MNKGFQFSIEVLLSVLIVTAILIAMPNTKPYVGLDKLIILQKQADLLNIWQEKEDFSNKSMLKSDFEFVFPNLGGKIIIEGLGEMIMGKSTENAVSVENYFVDDYGGLKKITILTYY